MRKTIKTKPGPSKGKAKQPEKSDRKYPAWWLLLAVAVVALLAYVQTLSYEFVHDDDFQVLRNPVIRDWRNIGHVFTTDIWNSLSSSKTSNYYRPVHMLLHMLGYQISRLEPYGYHAVSILLHVFATLIVTIIGYRLMGRELPAAAAGLLFALNPVHAESVAWVAGVTDPACAVFYFGALYFYIRENESRSWLYPSAFAVCFLAALLSKEMAFTFPLIAVLYDVCRRHKLMWSRYAVLAGTFGIYLLLRYQALGRLHEHQANFELNSFALALSMYAMLGLYLFKMFVPWDIHAFHVFVPTTSILSASFLTSSLIIGAFILGMWVFRKDRVLLFILAFCPVSILPVLNLNGIGENVFAERYLYIPTLGSSILIPLLILQIQRRIPARWIRKSVNAAGCLFGILLAGYFLTLQNTSRMWRDPYTLFSETFRRSPTASAMANSLGALHFYRGEYQLAREWFVKAMEAWDDNFIKSEYNLFDSHSGLGAVQLHSGAMENAIVNFRKAHEILPGEVSSLQNLGVAYATLGDYEQALEFYSRALEINPRSETTYNNLSALYIKIKRYEEAIRQAEKALEIHPKFVDAHLNLARANVGIGRHDLARESYERAVLADPSIAEVVEQELKKLP